MFCFIFQLIYYLTFEIFKLNHAPRFYYGNLGTSKEARMDNEKYQTMEAPMSAIYFYATLGLFLLFTIYSNAIVNCLHINAWCKGTDAMKSHCTIADKKMRYLHVGNDKSARASSELTDTTHHQAENRRLNESG